LAKGRIIYLCNRNREFAFFNFYDSFDYTVKKQGWMGGGTRSVKFARAAGVTSTVRIDKDGYVFEFLFDFF